MKNITKIMIASLAALVSFFIFNALEFDLLLLGFSKYIQSAIFAVSIGILILKPAYSFVIMIGACMLFAFTALFYLFGLIPLSNYSASIGIGLLTISALFSGGKSFGKPPKSS